MLRELEGEPVVYASAYYYLELNVAPDAEKPEHDL